MTHAVLYMNLSNIKKFDKYKKHLGDIYTSYQTINAHMVTNAYVKSNIFTSQ